MMHDSCGSGLLSFCVSFGKGKGRLVMVDNESGGAVMFINFNISFDFRMIALFYDSMC